jgi:hypothetical protein
MIVDEQEFICADCERRIVMFCGPEGTTHCGLCQYLPGWFNDPQLRAIFDPGYKPAEGSDNDVAR